MAATAMDTATDSTPYRKALSVIRPQASAVSEQLVAEVDPTPEQPEAPLEMVRVAELPKAIPSCDTHRTGPAELQIGGWSFDAHGRCPVRIGMVPVLKLSPS